MTSSKTASVPSLGELTSEQMQALVCGFPGPEEGMSFIVPPLGSMASEQHLEPLPPPLPTWPVEAASQPQQSLLLLGSSGRTTSAWHPRGEGRRHLRVIGPGPSQDGGCRLGKSLSVCME